MADEVITDTASIRTAFIESVCLNLPHLSETVGADFDAWLEAERQAASNETAKAIKAEIEARADLCGRTGVYRVLLGLDFAADIVAAHIKPGDDHA